MTVTTKRSLPLGLAPGLTAGLVAVFILGSTTEPARAQRAAACRVQFTVLSTVRFNAAHNLTGLVISGRHDPISGGAAPPSASDFEVLDTDGLLTLYILMNGWQASGQLERNARGSVAYHRSDLMLALEATQNGIAYARTVRAEAERRALPTLAEVAEGAQERIDGLQGLQDGIRRVIGSDGDMIEVSPGLITDQLAAFLDRFRPGGAERLFAQYSDLRAGRGPDVLCDPDSPSDLVGRLLCQQPFSGRAAPTQSACREGVTFSRLAAATRCQRASPRSADVCPAGG